MRELLARTAPAAEPLDAVAEAIPLARRERRRRRSPRRRSTGSIPRPRRPRSRASSRPAALVALIWNRRDERVDVDARALAHPRRARRRRAALRARALWRRGFDGNPAFAPLELRTWPHRGRPGRDVVLARVASMSFVAALDEEPRARLLAEVADLLDTHPGHARPRRRRAALRDGALHHAASASAAAPPSCSGGSSARRSADGGLVPVEVLLELPVVHLLAVVGPFARASR